MHSNVYHWNEPFKSSNPKSEIDHFNSTYKGAKLPLSVIVELLIVIASLTPLLD